MSITCLYVKRIVSFVIPAIYLTDWRNRNTIYMEHAEESFDMEYIQLIDGSGKFTLRDVIFRFHPEERNTIS